jgi:hypothetical protein
LKNLTKFRLQLELVKLDLAISTRKAKDLVFLEFLNICNFCFEKLQKKSFLKIKIPLEVFSVSFYDVDNHYHSYSDGCNIPLDFRWMAARFRWMTARFRLMTFRFH